MVRLAIVVFIFVNSGEIPFLHLIFGMHSRIYINLPNKNKVKTCILHSIM